MTYNRRSTALTQVERKELAALVSRNDNSTAALAQSVTIANIYPKVLRLAQGSTTAINVESKGSASCGLSLFRNVDDDAAADASSSCVVRPRPRAALTQQRVSSAYAPTPPRAHTPTRPHARRSDDSTHIYRARTVLRRAGTGALAGTTRQSSTIRLATQFG